jgi:hypothetical protein
MGCTCQGGKTVWTRGVEDVRGEAGVEQDLVSCRGNLSAVRGASCSAREGVPSSSRHASGRHQVRGGAAAATSKREKASVKKKFQCVPYSLTCVCRKRVSIARVRATSPVTARAW